MGSTESAIQAWRETLGGNKVDDADATRTRYGRTTLTRGTLPCCVLYPESVEDVQAVFRIAQEHGTVVHPISGGKNWGYGDACAPVDDAAIVDLGRMNRILQIDRELGYAVIEPGVTQQQLYEAVRVEAPEYWVDVTGAGPSATVVGNALERGFGHTPYADHVRSSCGMTVVLPDGRVLETGFGHFDGARARHCYPYGVGPILDGLFSQSNLGIVTRLGVWLCPKPEAFCFFLIKAPHEDQLPALVDALRPLRMHGILNSAVHIGNDLRVFASLDRYPWDAAGGETPLPDELRRKLRAEARLGAWNVTGSLTGTTAQVREARRRIRRACGHLGKIVFVGDRKLALGQRAAGFLERIGQGKSLVKNIAALVPNYGLLQGIPTDMPLQSLGWRLRGPSSGPLSDPLDSSIGLKWLAPVLPLRGDDARKVLALVAPVFTTHGFELPVTMTMLNERAMVAVMNISFDKADEGETERARACYAEVTEALLKAGYVPYRSSLAGMSHLVRPGDTFWDVARELKSALDPSGILSPGRYIPE